ncbi:MAG: hypothetical protein MPK05_08365, partial [Gammaproteobacteria bacterium]|nr:hypothetical protein [Gammaproteobacteria bacterium]
MTRNMRARREAKMLVNFIAVTSVSGCARGARAYPPGCGEVGKIRLALALVGVSKIAAINHGGKAKMTREYKCAFCKLQGVCAKK